jgi:hypothetical protein
MPIDKFEQRSAYRGSPPRPSLFVGFKRADGRHDLQLLADTGNPCAIVTSQAIMTSLSHRSAPDVISNFGLLTGGWLRLFMPEFGVDHEFIGYGSDAVAGATTKSDSDFEGLAGLPFLRLLEFGGDEDWFWLRSAAPLS